MMTQALEDITFTEFERAQVAALTESIYRRALELVQDANELRAAAGLSLPAGVVDLNAYRVPRQAAQR